jgi:hypothetical protein
MVRLYNADCSTRAVCLHILAIDTTEDDTFAVTDLAIGLYCAVIIVTVVTAKTLSVASDIAAAMINQSITIAVIPVTIGKGVRIAVLVVMVGIADLYIAGKTIYIVVIAVITPASDRCVAVAISIDGSRLLGHRPANSNDKRGQQQIGLFHLIYPVRPFTHVNNIINTSCPSAEVAAQVDSAEVDCFRSVPFAANKEQALASGDCAMSAVEESAAGSVLLPRHR